LSRQIVGLLGRSRPSRASPRPPPLAQSWRSAGDVSVSASYTYSYREAVIDGYYRCARSGCFNPCRAHSRRSVPDGGWNCAPRIAILAGLVALATVSATSRAARAREVHYGWTRNHPADRAGPSRMWLGLHRAHWRDRWGYWHWGRSVPNSWWLWA